MNYEIFLSVCVFLYNSAVLTKHCGILMIGPWFMVTAKDRKGTMREIFLTYFKVMSINNKTMKQIVQASRTI